MEPNGAISSNIFQNTVDYYRRDQAFRMSHKKTEYFLTLFIGYSGLFNEKNQINTAIFYIFYFRRILH